MNIKWLCVWVASGVAMSQSHVVSAQEVALEEIIVTAQKREQRIVDVPMSVAALTGNELADRGVQTIQDLSFAVPGLTLRLDGPGSQQIFLRGIGNLAGGEALVSVYMDEAPVTLYGFRQLDLRALDIERVEVLKGPQGTLYGQGAVAGTVRFVTVKPQLNRGEGRVESDLSYIDQGDSNVKVSGIANVPLVTDVLGLRIAATSESGGGWIDQPEAGIEDGNNQDLYNVRTQLRWRPSDALDINGTVVVYRLDSKLGLDWEQQDRTNNVPTDRARRLRPRIDRYELYNLTGSYDFGFASLVSATTYVDQLRDYSLGYIAGPAVPFEGIEGTDTIDDRSTMLTQEVRLMSNGEGAFQYTIGAFYRDVSSRLLDMFDTRLADGTYFPPAPFIDNNDSESLSFFVDGSYRITERLEVGAGVRHFSDDAAVSDGTVIQTETFDSTDPRVYVSYALTDAWNVYGNVAKGFRSGGFNRVPNPPYSPEEVISYEIGTKGTAGGLLQFDIAAYFSEYKDMLRRNQILVNGNDIQVITSNIGTVEIKGLEASLGWRVTDRLLLSANGAYIDSEVTELTNLDSVNRPGDSSDYVPELSYSLAGDYDFQWSPGIPGFLHLDYNYRDEVKFTDRLLYRPGFEVQTSESFGLLAARIGATWNNWTVELYGTNLTNTNRLVDPFDAFSQANRTKPRTIGLKVAVSLN